MEANHSYSFPFYRRVGQTLRPLIVSRYWILVVLTLALILYLPLLFAGFFQDDYGFRLEFSPEAAAKAHLPVEVMRNGPLNLYGFTPDSAERFALGRDKGFGPWWANPKIKTNFFRPLSSLTLALDFSLWPDTPLLPHLHSLLWFCALILLVYQLYRSLSGSVVVAGLSLLLFAVDDVFTGPAGWISNRHALIALVFGTLCLWLYQRAVADKQWSYLLGASGAYIVALLASEMGLVTFAYLFAYALVLDREHWLERGKRLVPFVLITIVWRLVYSALGYGATGTQYLYIDPILDPGNFITQALVRYPLLLSSVTGLPLADMLIAFSPQAMAVFAAFSLIPLGLLALSVFPVLKTHRTAAFWLIGLLCATVPLVSGIPGNRNLGFVSLGVMGLAGQLFVDVANMKRPAPLNTFQLVLLKITVPILAFLYFIYSPFSVLSNPSVTQTMARNQNAVANFGDSPELANQHIYVINPPGTMIYIPAMFQRLFTAEPFPASINYLSSGFAPVHIERVDERTIIVTPDGGYTPPPGDILDQSSGVKIPFHEQNVYRVLEENFYNSHDPMPVGNVTALSEVTIKVSQMTADGRIAQAVFTFAQPLEADRYVWLLWDGSTSTYTRVQMPPVGVTKVYP